MKIMIVDTNVLPSFLIEFEMSLTYFVLVTVHPALRNSSSTFPNYILGNVFCKLS